MQRNKSVLEEAVIDWGERHKYDVKPRKYRQEIDDENEAFASMGASNYLENIGFVKRLPSYGGDSLKTGLPHFIRMVYTPTGFLSYSCVVEYDPEAKLNNSRRINSALRSVLKVSPYPYVEFVQFRHGEMLSGGEEKIFDDRASSRVAEIIFAPVRTEIFTSDDLQINFNLRLLKRTEPLSQLMLGLVSPHRKSLHTSEVCFSRVIKILREKLLASRSKRQRETDVLYLDREYNSGDWLLRNAEGYGALLDVFDSVIQGTLPPYRRRQ